MWFRTSTGDLINLKSAVRLDNQAGRAVIYAPSLHALHYQTTHEGLYVLATVYGDDVDRLRSALQAATLRHPELYLLKEDGSAEVQPLHGPPGSG